MPPVHHSKTLAIGVLHPRAAPTCVRWPLHAPHTDREGETALNLHPSNCEVPCT